MLREHFRCMPEIIQWSARAFYDDRLISLRQFGADRLNPLVLVEIKDAEVEGSGDRLVNITEANELIGQVEKLVADPAYRDPVRTIGVIALHSPQQVKYIDDQLRQRLGPEDLQRFRIRVGMPPAFQGDQRHVMLLSMVYAQPVAAMTSRRHQRHYNVAVSRAEDQLWVFTSLPATATLPKGDMRAALLSYLRHPPRVLTVDPALDHADTDVLQVPFDSLLEQRVYLHLRQAGYAVVHHHPINDRHVDLLVVGDQGQLGVHCDAPQPDLGPRELRDELQLHQVLIRSGWHIIRVRDSEYHYDPDTALAPLWAALAERGIEPRQLPANPRDKTVWVPPELSNNEDDE